MQSSEGDGAPCAGDAARRATGDTVVFNAGGRRFEVLAMLIRAHPSTLLAHLVDDVDVDATRVIFVEANQDRFSYILDWYRYGEMFLPPGCPVDALLRDAKYFMLPDFVKIDGRLYGIGKARAEDLNEKLRSCVLAKWPTFPTYLNKILNDVGETFDSLCEGTDDVKHPITDCSRLDKEARESICFALPLADPVVQGRREFSCEWSDASNVCNVLRLQVLLDELRKLGYECRARHENYQVAAEVRVPPPGNWTRQEAPRSNSFGPDAYDRAGPVRSL